MKVLTLILLGVFFLLSFYLIIFLPFEGIYFFIKALWLVCAVVSAGAFMGVLRS